MGISKKKRGKKISFTDTLRQLFFCLFIYDLEHKAYGCVQIFPPPIDFSVGGRAEGALEDKILTYSLLSQIKISAIFKQCTIKDGGMGGVMSLNAGWGLDKF